RRDVRHADPHAGAQRRDDRADGRPPVLLHELPLAAHASPSSEPSPSRRLIGPIDKHTFRAYVEAECDRQLLLMLGKGDDAWLAPNRRVTPRRRTTRLDEPAVAALGRQYEQSVYQRLTYLPQTRADTAPSGEAIAVR